MICKDRLLIIDGNNLLFQMFYGFPTKIYNKSGETIHATIGFISYLIKQINTFNINKAVVVFDKDSSSERINAYSEYKANRFNNWNTLNNDEIPFNEEKYICKCLDYLKIRFIFSEYMEADDIIASLALSLQNDCNVIISSFDSDFFQLINNNIQVLRYKGKASVLYDTETFYNKYSFLPNKYILYKSLIGDSSDNIKGIKGIGDKTAKKILLQCSSFEDIYIKMENILPLRLQNELLNDKEKLYLNKKLITLDYKEEINYNIHDFCFDIEKAKQSNTLILSNCKVFD